MPELELARAGTVSRDGDFAPQARRALAVEVAMAADTVAARERGPSVTVSWGGPS